jgi:hypothetical protein
MAIPQEIVDWFRGIFADVNRRLCEKMCNVPGTPETNFDLAFIEHLTNYAAPRKFKSDWAIRIDTHYLGALRHLNNWEVADIGVFVFFTKNRKVVRRKVALLQSKRLFPLKGDVEHLEEYDYRIGMARIAAKGTNLASMMAQRVYEFTEACRYKSLMKVSDQVAAITAHVEQYGIPVHYLFYNPPTVPLKVIVPLTRHNAVTKIDVGARVVPVARLYEFLDAKGKTYSPSLADSKSLMSDPDAKPYGWRLEHFMADLLLGCRQGHRYTRDDDIPIEALFYRRSGPIAAAIAVTVEMPEDAALPE